MKGIEKIHKILDLKRIKNKRKKKGIVNLFYRILGFGFIDSWGYLERKNDREIKNVKITLSPWLYELCCAKGNLLKSHRDYFELTSGLT